MLIGVHVTHRQRTISSRPSGMATPSSLSSPTHLVDQPTQHTKEIEKTRKRRTKDIQKTYKRHTKDVQRRTEDVQTTYKRHTKDVQMAYKGRTNGI